MRVHLKTLGCRLNEAELETWARQFHAAGHPIVAEAEQADVIVLNSCAVTADAVRKSRHALRKLNRENPQAHLVVSGCYATLQPEQAAAALGVDLVVPNTDKARLVELTQSALQLDSAPAFAMEPGEHALFQLGRQRAFIKVQDGCRYRCTFCIVTVARGEERSRSPADIVDEINALHRQGVQEAVLTGVHLGGYGSDLESDLASLIRSVLAQTDIPRLRLGSLEPWDLPADFFSLFADPRLLPHLHLPLQSGSDSVLRRMARRCKRADYLALLDQARAEVPGIQISTDLIVGFPGETEAEWADTLSALAQAGFSHVHVFSYSARTGTKAASLPDPLPDAVKKSRSQQLHALAQTSKTRTLHRQLGQTAAVLWEGYRETLPDGRVRQFGYTPNYQRAAVDLPAERNLCGQILNWRAERLSANGDYLLGALLDD